MKGGESQEEVGEVRALLEPLSSQSVQQRGRNQKQGWLVFRSACVPFTAPRVVPRLSDRPPAFPESVHAQQRDSGASLPED